MLFSGLAFGALAVAMFKSASEEEAQTERGRMGDRLPRDGHYGFAIAAPLVTAPVLAPAIVLTMAAAAAVGAGAIIWDQWGRPVPDFSDVDLRLIGIGLGAAAAVSAIPTIEALDAESARVVAAAKAAGVSVVKLCAWSLSPMLIAKRLIDTFLDEANIAARHHAAIREAIWSKWNLLARLFKDPSFLLDLVKKGYGVAAVDLGAQAMIMLAGLAEAMVEAVMLGVSGDAELGSGLFEAKNRSLKKLTDDLDLCYRKGGLKGILGPRLRAWLTNLSAGFRTIGDLRKNKWVAAALTALAAFTTADGYYDERISSNKFVAVMDVFTDLFEQHVEDIEDDGLLAFDFLLDFNKAVRMTEKVLKGEAAQWKVGPIIGSPFFVYLVSSGPGNFRYDEGSVPAGEPLTMFFSTSSGMVPPFEADPIRVSFAPHVEGEGWFYYEIERDPETGRPRPVVVLARDGSRHPMRLEENGTLWSGSTSAKLGDGNPFQGSKRVLDVPSDPTPQVNLTPPPPRAMERQEDAMHQRPKETAQWHNISVDQKTPLRFQNMDTMAAYGPLDPMPTEENGTLYQLIVWDGAAWVVDGEPALWLPGEDEDIAWTP